MTFLLLESSTFGCSCIPQNTENVYSTTNRFVKAVPTTFVAVNEFQNVYTMTVSKRFQTVSTWTVRPHLNYFFCCRWIFFQLNQPYIIPPHKFVETEVVPLYACQVSNHLKKSVFTFLAFACSNQKGSNIFSHLWYLNQSTWLCNPRFVKQGKPFWMGRRTTVVSNPKLQHLSHRMWVVFKPLITLLIISRWKLIMFSSEKQFK